MLGHDFRRRVPPLTNDDEWSRGHGGDMMGTGQAEDDEQGLMDL